jgi:hypothetical protein
MEYCFVNLHSILGLALLQGSLVIPVGILDTVQFHLSSTISTLRMLFQTARMRYHLVTGFSFMRYDFLESRRISIYKNVKPFASWLSDLHMSIKDFYCRSCRSYLSIETRRKKSFILLTSALASPLSDKSVRALHWIHFTIYFSLLKSRAFSHIR